jgi:hypothetical protein
MGRRMARFIIVGFKISEENSVYYKKCRDIEELKKALETAFELKDADFVSIRKVKKGDSE